MTAGKCKLAAAALEGESAIKGLTTTVQRRCHHFVASLGWFSLGALALVAQAVRADDGNLPATPSFDIQFNRDVRPILSDRCFHCHGPDAESREADLRLDVPESDNVQGWTSVADTDLESSQLWERITSTDPDSQMPPPTAHKKPLSESERGIIGAWLKQGAPFEQFWAFSPPVEMDPPILPVGSRLGETSMDDWAKTPIDKFVARRLLEKGRSVCQPADRRTLIRRLSLDLTGLPPTEAELEAFLSDDSPQAYAAVVDRLLSSSRYGEHMAKYWLDLVRFADTNGIHHDHFRELTPFRDWVIRSFNNNHPFNDFAVEQLAGDLLPNPTNDQLIASGFNRLHLVIDKGTALPEESHTRNVVDRVTAVGTAFMGLTVGCAVCHDHKYDPVSQRDFYRLYAFFNNIDATPETPGRGVHQPAIRLPTAQQEDQLGGIDDQIASLKREVTALKPEDTEEPTAEFTDKEKRLKRLEKQRTEIENGVLTTLIMRERLDPRPAHILIRGAYDQPGEKVERGTPDFLPPLVSRGDTPDRLDLAYWLTDGQHPLMARVTVNRFWQQLFGVGLVRTSEDFGAQGEMPSHPELLDYLANEFVRSGWDVKKLMRRIVMTNTYRQDSSATEDDYLIDPQNRLLARGSRYRLDAEIIRDQCLFVSGLLNEQMFGRSVKPPQPPNLWKNVSMVSSSTYAFKADSGEDIYRRSLYTFWKRALPPPQMTIFDAPTRESCIARRERTNTPLQALVLMNEQLFFQAAVELAATLKIDEQLSVTDCLATAMRRITSREADSRESALMLESYKELLARYQASPETASEVISASPTAASNVAASDSPSIAALSLVINGLFNLDITKTRQ